MPRLTIIAVLLILCGSAPRSFAQPLADRVPADAIVYVGWKGAGDLGSGYDQSHLKAVVGASNLPQLFTEFLPSVAQKVRGQDAQSADVIDLVTAVGGPLWRHPSAFYFGGINMDDPRRPLPRVALLCDAGDEAPALLKQLTTAIARIEDQSVPLRASALGSVVVISTHEFPNEPGPALSARKEFTGALAQVQKDAVITGYVDGEAALQLADTLVNAQGDAQAAKRWPAAKAALGLDGLKRFAWTGGFDGRDWGYRAFIEAPAPRSGLPALLDGKPITDDTLKLIPASATMAAAGHFDLASLLTQTKGAGEKLDPDFAMKFGMVMGMADGMLGMDVEADLIEPLGSEWAYFVSPDVGGAGLLGMTLINRLDDAAKTEAALARFATGFNDAVRQQMRNAEVTIEIRRDEVDGTTMHYLAVPLITPAWAVKHGNLYVSLYPQVLASALAHQPGKDKSILENQKFTDLRKRLGVPAGGASSVQFADLERTVPVGYGTWLLVSRYIGMADLFGMKAPAMLIPPMHVLQQHLAPAGAVTWTDDAGWHMRGTSPFPGSETLATDPVSSFMVGQPAVMISILLPSLNRARETANRVKCASNLKQIGLAMLMYSNENKGKYPATLGELLRTQDIPIDVFTCPSSNDTVPPDVRAAGMDAMVEWVNENSSYVYAGAGKTNASPAEDVLLYEHLHNHDHDGINLLFGDGHVEFLLQDGAMKLLNDQNLAAER